MSQYINKPANLHFSVAWSTLPTLSLEEKEYKLAVEDIVCQLVNAINKAYPTKKAREIYVVPDNAMRVLFVRNYRLHIAKLKDFKKSVIINNNPISVFDYREPAHYYNLVSNICHELGHIVYEDAKFPFYKTCPSNLLLISLRETRADIFSKNLMDILQVPAHYDWFSEEGYYGYFEKSKRIALLNSNTVYNHIIIDAIRQEYIKMYGFDMQEKSIKYLIKKYPKEELGYFEYLLGVPLK